MAGRHRRLLMPWWKRNPANTAIAVSAMLATGTTTTGAALNLTPGTQQGFVDPDPTMHLTYSAQVATGVLHDATPPPAQRPMSPTDPPTDPITRPTVIMTMVPVSPTTGPSPRLSFGEKLSYLASLQAGKPYVYGGTGPYSFDCSGLVWYVYKQLGRSVPRTAQAQFDASERVSQDSKEIGDLIFFGTPGNIYHDGIYAGNGQMWVAPHDGENVQLQAIWTSHYYVGRL